jgi:potassium-transporting ATPase potassium-binding subunit
MNAVDLAFLIVFFALLVAASVFIGKYMAKVFSSEKTFMSPMLRPLERGIYRLCGVDESEDMSGKRYAKGFFIFTIAGITVLFLMQLFQHLLPLNPQKLSGVRWDTALNTAVSFATNTNWQSYGGESTMSYFVQMTGLAVQNFLSAAVGMAAGVAFIRGFTRKESKGIGNIWVDLTRSTLYVLIPLAIIISFILISQGVIQTFHAYITAETLEGGKQVIPLGPAASQIAIKQIGTNGGGFFNANSAHPFENPTMISNLIENFSILLLPFAFVFMFGYMIKNNRQGRAIFAVMSVLFVLGLTAIIHYESKANPMLPVSSLSGSVNMEGKETRFGVLWSAVWSQSTTVTSNGSVNAMHDSFMPLSGLVQMFNMGIGEVIFGGVGVGFIGMMFFVILSMFLAGLMIGRTPEFMGKKFGPYEMMMSMIALVLPMIALVLISAIAVSLKTGLSSLNNPSSHGLSEILYAASSCIGNNGSAFAGLNVSTPFYNCILSSAILIGRFATAIPALVLAGSLAQKKIIPDSSATFPTTGILFVGIVVSVVIIMGALTFFPVYTLGPILEHMRLYR